jgi:hypothetical protein
MKLPAFHFPSFFRDKQKALRSIRSLEKRVRDATTTADDTQKLVNNYKEQVIIRFIEEKFQLII